MTKLTKRFPTLYPSGYDYWVTIDKVKIPYNKLGDQHLRNCIKMCEKNKKTFFISDLYMEDLYRKVTELLLRDKTQLALWLTSDNPIMRKVAERCNK